MVMPLISAPILTNRTAKARSRPSFRQPAVHEHEQHAEWRKKPEQPYALEQPELAEAVADPAPGRVRRQRPGGLCTQQDGYVGRVQAEPVSGDDVERERHQSCPAEPLREQEEAEASVGPRTAMPLSIKVPKLSGAVEARRGAGGSPAATKLRDETTMSPDARAKISAWAARKSIVTSNR